MSFALRENKDYERFTHLNADETFMEYLPNLPTFLAFAAATLLLGLPLGAWLKDCSRHRPGHAVIWPDAGTSASGRALPRRAFNRAWEN